MSARIQKTHTKSKFTKEEDQRLREIISKIGPSWKEVAEHMGNRTPRQCKERWTTYLSNGINLSKWDPLEDEMLTNAVNEFGRQWSIIRNIFRSRTETNIKNRWAVISKRKNDDTISIKNNNIQVNQSGPDIYSIFDFSDSEITWTE